jgi:hypothetical protein
VKSEAWEGGVHELVEYERVKTVDSDASASRFGVVGRSYPYNDIRSGRVVSRTMTRKFGPSGFGLKNA